jgi:hypothetical protein
MQREAVLQVRTYRGYRLEVRDDGWDGWVIVVHPDAVHEATATALRNGLPHGLEHLLAEAHDLVDRLCDGPGAGTRV